MTRPKVFYSWQSDLIDATNHTLIGEALQAALKEIGQGADAIEPELDRDTLRLPGAPNIRDAIITKIDSAAVFVADVTPVGKSAKGRYLPNPNVMFELGYAVKRHGWERIVMVLNTDFAAPEALPFDFRQHLVLIYSSAPDAEDRSSARNALQVQLRQSLITILGAAKVGLERKLFELTVLSKADGRKPNEDRYQLEVQLTNRGTSIVKEWVITIEMPQRVLVRGMSHFHQVRVENEARRAHFRFDEKDSPRRGKAIDPDTSEVRSIPFCMNDSLYDDDALPSETVVVKAYVNGEQVADLIKPFRDLLTF
jgi:hypothetical protein